VLVALVEPPRDYGSVETRIAVIVLPGISDAGPKIEFAAVCPVNDEAQAATVRLQEIQTLSIIVIEAGAGLHK
jgi:hypothetical protein